MKKKETTEEVRGTLGMDQAASFHQKLDRELNFNIKMKHSSRDSRYKRTPYDELREQGNLHAAYFKEQFALISEKQCKLPSRTRRVIVYEITLAVHTIMEREKALEAKREKAKRTAIPAVIASPMRRHCGHRPAISFQSHELTK